MSLRRSTNWYSLVEPPVSIDSGDRTPFYDWIDRLGINNFGDTVGDPAVYVRHN